jgi:hypothetical protein
VLARDDEVIEQSGDFRSCEGFRMPADDGRRRERCG